MSLFTKFVLVLNVVAVLWRDYVSDGLMSVTTDAESTAFKFALFTLALLGVAAWREGRPEQSSR